MACTVCGEGINDRRELYIDGQPVCRACAGGGYYRHVLPLAESMPVLCEAEE